jgi:putative transcriptional regulator
VIFVAYTERGDRVRIITARRATRHERDDYFQQNGQRLEPLRPMTEAEVMAAALADPDAKPLTPDDIKHMKRIPRAKIIRRALGLTQEEFSARFRIPLGTLRDWEQGAAEPDQAARAYLTVIARNPRAVADALMP